MPTKTTTKTKAPKALREQSGQVRRFRQVVDSFPRRGQTRQEFQDNQDNESRRPSQERRDDGSDRGRNDSGRVGAEAGSGGRPQARHREICFRADHGEESARQSRARWPPSRSRNQRSKAFR